MAFAITLTFAFIYVAVQQQYRNAANDPQIQLAEDVAEAMNAGAKAEEIVPQAQIDPSKSLSPYILIYDKDNKALGSDVVVNGKPPTVSEGILNAARDAGSSMVTWEPEAGVRNAIVSVKTDAGDIVVVGRSLRSTDLRIQQLMIMGGGALVVTLLGTFLVMWMVEAMALRPKKVKPEPMKAGEPPVIPPTPPTV